MNNILLWWSLMLNQLIREGLQNFIILAEVFTKGGKWCIFHWKIGVFPLRLSILTVANTDVRQHFRWWVSWSALLCLDNITVSANTALETALYNILSFSSYKVRLWAPPFPQTGSGSSSSTWIKGGLTTAPLWHRSAAQGPMGGQMGGGGASAGLEDWVKMGAGVEALRTSYFFLLNPPATYCHPAILNLHQSTKGWMISPNNYVWSRAQS